MLKKPPHVEREAVVFDKVANESKASLKLRPVVRALGRVVRY